MPDRPTLAELLPARLDRMGEEARRKLCENEEIGCMTLAWDFIASELRDALASALDCDLMTILASCWAEAQPLLEYADRSRHPPGERAVVELCAHDIERELQPVVVVTVGSCPCVELEFTLTLSAHFGGVKLSIADGCITAVRAGDVWAGAQLSYAGMPLHPEAESRKLALPGEIRFDPPGIRIPPLEEALPLTPAPPPPI
jgi:hypothetical protein